MKFTMKQIKAAQATLVLVMSSLEKNGHEGMAVSLMLVMQAVTAAKMFGREDIEVFDFVPFAEEKKHG